MMRSRYQDRLEAIFGLMDPNLRGIAPTPNDLSSELAAMCRALATTSANEMLYLVDYLVADWRGANPRDFASFLFNTTGEPKDWDFRDILFIYPKVTTLEWQNVSVANYVDSYANVPGERWFWDKLSRPSLFADRNEVGTILRHLRYYETPKLEGFVVGVIPKGSPYENLISINANQIPTLIRRLIAKRLGRNAASLLLKPGSPITVDGLVRAANIDVATMSADAKQALEAIVIEMDGGGGSIEKADRCVGEGSDDLYR